MYALEGVSIGFQFGGEATDFVLLGMNPKGARSLLSRKVKLGAPMPLPPLVPSAGMFCASSTLGVILTA
jgi:lipid-binding SYLF domain-containing protein